MNNFLWHEQWFRGVADGAWEHTHALHIETTDSPGWRVTIDLNGTPFADVPNALLKQMAAGGADWMDCRVVAGIFRAQGGVLMLGPIVQVFRDWIGTF